MLWRIVYISSAISRDFSADAENILQIARLENGMRDITGLLTFCDGAIFQVLEGEREDVEDTFARIQRDRRHRSVIQLLSEAIQRRDFADWEMAWLDIPRGHRLEPEISATLGQAKAAGADVSGEIRVLLDTFSDLSGAARKD